MKLFRLAAACAAILALGACTTLPKTPAQTVYAVEGNYTAALTVKVAYKNLPACGGAALVCSDPAVVAKLQVADDAAYAAIMAAEGLVRAGASADAQIEAAINAVKVLQDLTTNVKVK